MWRYSGIGDRAGQIPANGTSTPGMRGIASVVGVPQIHLNVICGTYRTAYLLPRLRRLTTSGDSMRRANPQQRLLVPEAPTLPHRRVLPLPGL